MAVERSKYEMSTNRVANILWPFVLVCGVFIFFLSEDGTVQAAESELVDRFMNEILGPGASPTLADYWFFVGRSSETELGFELAQCARRGWIPVLESPDCIAYTRARAATPDSSPSFYFEWLRTKLPTNSVKYEIVAIQENKGEAIGDRVVSVRVDDILVTFVATTDPDLALVFGHLSPLSVDGTNIREMARTEFGKPWE